MRLRRKTAQPPRESLMGEDWARSSAPTRYIDGVTRRRTIDVGDARTIVVRPRIAPWYKALLGLSLALNAIVLVLLLTVGLEAYRFYRAFSGELGALTSGSTAGARVSELGDDPARAALATIDLARHGVGEALGAVRQLENATMRGQVRIDRQIPLQVQIPIDQNTVAVTNAPVPLEVPAQFYLPGGGGSLNGVVSLSLPGGTQLPVHLALSAPLSTTVPVQWDVPFSVPIRETELQGPFARLRQLLEPAAEFFGTRQE